MGTTNSILFQKLLVILHRGLAQTRDLARSSNCQQVYDLADTFEVLPEMMAYSNVELDRVREILAQYQAKYPGTAYDYLAMLDMDDASFRSIYQMPEDAEPEFAERK